MNSEKGWRTYSTPSSISSEECSVHIISEDGVRMRCKENASEVNSTASTGTAQREKKG